MNTSKKMKVVGTEIYTNVATGELHEMNVVEVEEKDAHFQKLWIANILAAVNELSSQRLKLVFWLVAEAPKHKNVIPITIKKLAETLKMSRTTVTETIKILEKHDIIRRQIGVIWMNPNVVYQGGRNGRMEVLVRYSKVSKEKKSSSNTSEQIQKRLNLLTKEMSKLQNELNKLSAEAAAE